MDYLDKIFEKNADIVSRKIDDEFVLIPVCKRVQDMNCIYTLDEVSGRIWDLIGDKRSVKDIKRKLLTEYDVAPKDLEKDLIETIKEFKKINCIVEAPNA